MSNYSYAINDMNIYLTKLCPVCSNDNMLSRLKGLTSEVFSYANKASSINSQGYGYNFPITVISLEENIMSGQASNTIAIEEKLNTISTSWKY